LFSGIKPCHAPRSVFRTLVAIAVVASVGVVVAAPARVVRGVVTIAGSSRPIAGATVLTEGGEIAVSDLDGYFTLNVLPTDRELTVTAPGYATRTVPLVGGDALLHIVLAASSGSEVIEVTGKAPEQTKPLTYQLSADEIRFLPGAANDVLRA